jgi:hypothetical protein
MPCKRGNLVEAIKLMRAGTGLGLKETKDALEAYMRGEPPGRRLRAQGIARRRAPACAGAGGAGPGQQD